MFDRATFYDTIRGSLFHNKLTIHEVAGMDAVIDAFVAQGLSDSRWLAAILAEIYGEVGAPMWPIHEGGEGRGHPYGKPGHNSGQIPFGRGFDQCTWDENYEKTDRDLGLKGALIANYDLLLEPKTAALAIVTGMVSGRYRRFKLADYLNDHVTDWVHCRLIINPDKRGPELALKAVEFNTAILAGQRKSSDASPVMSTRPVAPKTAVAPVPDPLSSLIADTLGKALDIPGAIVGTAIPAGGSSPAVLGSTATTESSTMSTATAQPAVMPTSFDPLSTLTDFFKGVNGKLATAHAMTTSGSSIATGVITSLPEIPTVVEEITALVADVELGSWAAIPNAAAALIFEFDKIAGKFGLDLSALDAFVRKLPFVAAIPAPAS